MQLQIWQRPITKLHYLEICHSNEKNKEN